MEDSYQDQMPQDEEGFFGTGLETQNNELDEFIPLQEHQKKQEKKIDYYSKLLQPKQEVEETAPLVCVVQGPPKCGKSTLIQSLIKHYTKHKVNQILGTLTVRVGKRQRVSFVQCPNEMNHMIDLAKICDLALVMIDSSIGFEMQTFQFLSLLKAHGMPNVMGILNHLDFFKDGKTLRKTRKQYKRRFQAEAGSNCRLFYLQGIKHQLYLKRDTINLARFISIIKYQSSPWKLNHPYLLVDRYQIHRDYDDEQVDVLFNGYVRNASYRLGGKVHLVGLGDYQMQQYKALEDPCPPLLKGNIQLTAESSDQQQQQKQQTQKKQQKTKRARKIKESQRILFAPACNLGYLSVEQTGGYVTIPDDYVVFTKRERQNDQEQQQEQLEEGVRIMRQLQSHKAGIDHQLNSSSTLLINDITLNQQQAPAESALQTLRKKAKALKKLKKRTQSLIIQEQQQQEVVASQTDLSKLIYGSKQSVCAKDCSRFTAEQVLSRQEYRSFMKDKFVTGSAIGLQQQQKELEQNQNQQEAFQKVQISPETNFIKRGQYISIVLKGLNKDNFCRLSYRRPIILTKINIAQDTFGYVVARIKKHPWYGNLLKSNDPILVSAGWRRYQTIPTFYTTDTNQRNRFLKYTPQHDFCQVVFYGNFNTQNTGIVFNQTNRDDIKKFRISATGFVVEFTQQPNVMKKLKLVGQPFKIYKNTAFVKGMFNSTAQVNKYIGAQIRTVSGIRGQIKKSLKEGGQGAFRATFQDKILKSDIVFCKTWFRIKIEKFYNPVQTYEPVRLMKTTWQLRRQRQILPQTDQDSNYRNIIRAPKKSSALLVPKKLQNRLPFQSLEKKKSSKKKALAQRQAEGIPKLLNSPSERQLQFLVQRLQTIRNQKQTLKNQKTKEHKRIKEARQRPAKQQAQARSKERKKSKIRDRTK